MSLGAVSAETRFPAHAAIETYSVLTRLPEPYRFESGAARAVILETFVEPFLHLSPSGYRSLIQAAPDQRIVGGALYDAVIAETAREAGATLLTRDRRAVPIYDALGVPWEFVD